MFPAARLGPIQVRLQSELPAWFAALPRSCTAATSASSAKAAATPTTPALDFRARLVDIQGTTGQVDSVQRRDGSVRFSGIHHFDEGKSPGPSSITIGHQADPFHSAIRFKQGPDRILSRTEIQIPYENFLHSDSPSRFESGLNEAESDFGQVWRDNQIPFIL
jgi:hypothetical protein